MSITRVLGTLAYLLVIAPVTLVAVLAGVMSVTLCALNVPFALLRARCLIFVQLMTAAARARR